MFKEQKIRRMSYATFNPYSRDKDEMNTQQANRQRLSNMKVFMTVFNQRHIHNTHTYNASPTGSANAMYKD